MIGLGVLLAVLAATGNSGATLLESTAPAVRRARLRGGLYVAGLLLDLIGWLLSLAALRFLPLFAVQSIVTGQVVLTVLVGGWLAERRARAQDLIASLVMIAALAVIVIGADGDQPVRLSLTAVPVLAGTVVVVVVVAVASRHRPWLAPTLLAGACFSVAVVLARAVHPQLHPADGVAAAVGSPGLWLVLLFGGAGTLTYLWALSRGGPGAVLAVLSITEIVLPGAAGALLLGDGVRQGWLLPCLLSLAAAIGATVVLARSPAQRMSRVTLFGVTRSVVGREASTGR